MSNRNEPTITNSGREEIRRLSGAPTSTADANSRRRSTSDVVREKVRGVFAKKGVLTVDELGLRNPQVEYKAAYRARLDAIDKRRQERDEERGKPAVRPGLARALRRAQAAHDARQRRKGQRAYTREMEGRAARARTALSMSRAATGEFDHVSPHIRTNVLATLTPEQPERAGA